MINPTKKLSSLLLVTLLAATSAHAWDDGGHMLVAQIAYSRLSPAKQQKLNALCQTVSENGHPSYNAVTAACYPDDQKRAGHKQFSKWHYIDIELEDSDPSAAAAPNAVTAIQKCIDVYKGTASLQNGNHKMTKGEAIASLMHYVGDIHQPLHAADHHDTGGNDVKVPNLDSPYPELHSYWDSAFQRTMDASGRIRITMDVSRPASVPSAAIAAQAASLEQKYKPGPIWTTSNPATWAKESHTLAVKFGYDRLPGGRDVKSVTLDKTYTDAGCKITGQRVVLAGYRLAALLDSLL